MGKKVQKIDQKTKNVIKLMKIHHNYEKNRCKSQKIDYEFDRNEVKNAKNLLKISKKESKMREKCRNIGLQF